MKFSFKKKTHSNKFSSIKALSNEISSIMALSSLLTGWRWFVSDEMGLGWYLYHKVATGDGESLMEMSNRHLLLDQQLLM